MTRGVSISNLGPTLPQHPSSRGASTLAKVAGSTGPRQFPNSRFGWFYFLISDRPDRLLPQQPGLFFFSPLLSFHWIRVLVLFAGLVKELRLRLSSPAIKEQCRRTCGLRRGEWRAGKECGPTDPILHWCALRSLCRCPACSPCLVKVHTHV